MVRILLLGTYGQDNIGDEAILEVFLKYLSEHDIFVSSSNPELTRKNFDVYSVHTYREPSKMLRTLFSSDVVLFGGGSLLKELNRNMGRWRYSVLLHTFLGVTLAKLLRKKVVFSAIGIGPISSFFSRSLTRLSIALADLSTVRDSGSRELLEELGVKNKVYVVADPTFLIQNSTEENTRMLERARALSLRVGICASHYLQDDIDYEEVVSCIARFCDYSIEKYNAEILLVPFQFGYNPYDDVRVNEDILRCVRNKSKIFTIEGIDSAEKMLRLFSDVNIILGVRLHSLIFALMKEVPFLAIVYDDKAENFLKDIDWKYCLDIGTLKLEELVAKFEKLLDDRTEVLRKMEDVKVIMTRRAMLNFHMMRQFMGQSMKSDVA